MPVIKIKVERNLEQLHGRMRRLMDAFSQLSRPMVLSNSGWMPAVDVFQGDDTVFIVVEAAGIDKDNIHLTWDGHFLRLAGHRKCPVSLDGRHFHQMEIEYGPFERIIRIPAHIDPERIEALYENGLLTIRIPCRKSSDKIRINVS
ncbi:MAG TPA: Hsp20/alpha crystallin family protein [Thermodesulfobacteriaceae bacterium]|nr:Hsp20/alpha crystallin family protein [Thermodesulfobacteriaceae bacterium]